MPEWMTEPVLLAIIGGIFSVMIALIDKLTVDVSKTRKDAVAVHQSINNRPTSLSDGMDVLGTGIEQVKGILNEHGKKLEDHTDDIGRLRRDIGDLRDDDQELRSSVKEVGRKLTTHTKATADWTPMLNDLHTKYVEDKRTN